MAPLTSPRPTSPSSPLPPSTPKSLQLLSLSQLLSSLTSPTPSAAAAPHTAILAVSTGGHLLGYHSVPPPSSSPRGEKRVRMLVGVSAALWREEWARRGEEVLDTGEAEEEEVGLMVECELGRVLIQPIRAAPLHPRTQSRPPPTPPDSPPLSPSPASLPDPPPFLAILNSTDSCPWGILHAKAKALTTHLQHLLFEVDHSLLALPSSTSSTTRAPTPAAASKPLPT